MQLVGQAGVQKSVGKQEVLISHGQVVVRLAPWACHLKPWIAAQGGQTWISAPPAQREVEVRAGR